LWQKKSSTTNINSDKNNNKMLFQYKANEELVRSVYETQMGEKSSGTIDKDGNRMLLSSDYSVRQWSDRKKKVVVPLFNSYVFVQVADSDRSLVFQSVGAVRYLFWLGKPAIVRDEEIGTIKSG
jgi:transcription antitermination factor NusG